MPEEGIDPSDIPEWIPGPDAVRGYHWRRMSEEVDLTIDADVLDWLKSSGKGYQSRLNAILREAMLKEAATPQTIRYQNTSRETRGFVDFAGLACHLAAHGAARTRAARSFSFERS